MPVYIEQNNGDVNRPTDRPTDRANIEQSAFLKVRQKKKGRDLQIFHLYDIRKVLPCPMGDWVAGRQKNGTSIFQEQNY